MTAPTDQEIILITGANTGLGFQIAKVLLRDHGGRFHVLVGCRTLSKGAAAVKELHDQGLQNCEVLHIEVTSDESIALAAKTVEQKFGRLDVLHVNAGIAYPDKDWLPAGESVSKCIMESMRTNVAGAAQTAETFIPLLQKSNNPRVVFMSSSLGSLTLASKDLFGGINAAWPAYCASKAAMSMIVLLLWSKYGKEMRINACSPGFRGTALNDYGEVGGGSIKPGPLELGARNAVRLSLLGKDGESGKHTQWKDNADEPDDVPW